MVLRFLRQSALRALPIVIGVALYVAWGWDTFPAPPITSNISVNEKVHRVALSRQRNVDVLALGSSMTLNNLASGPVVEHFGTTHYVNAGAWGIGALAVSRMAPPLVRHLRPRQVIMVSNLVDFTPVSTMTDKDTAAIAEHLRSPGGIGPYLTHWNAPYYLRQMSANRIRFHDAANYEYLGFDAYGGAALSVPDERIAPARFNEPIPAAEEFDEDRYKALQDLARFLRSEQVEFLVICSPHRDGLRTPEGEAVAQAHVARLRSILLPLGHRLVDAHVRQWPDSLFCDADHFDREGAELFTRWSLEQDQ
jgi:hypothetical protein